MIAPLLDVRGVSKRFRGLRVLDALNFRVETGERCGLIGPNGSGKTTLINIIAGSVRPDKGSLHFAGVDITALPAHRRSWLGIARSFQIPKPFATMTVLENVDIPLAYGAPPVLPPSARSAEATRVLSLVGLMPKANARPRDLSQVEMRKLELARALAARPRLLLLDEVLAGLATSEIDEILEVLQALNEKGTSIVMIEHIMRAVMTFSERVVVLNAGTKIAEGTPDDVINLPAVEAAFLGE
jgi:branched-chain amino acid transport system ATP-binding protein